MIIENILIEKTDSDVLFKNPIGVFRNHNSHEKIGTVELFKKDGLLYGNFNLKDNDEEYKTLYPSMGYKFKGEIKEVVNIGLSYNPNEDESIKTIGAQIFARST